MYANECVVAHDHEPEQQSTSRMYIVIGIVLAVVIIGGLLGHCCMGDTKQNGSHVSQSSKDLVISESKENKDSKNTNNIELNEGSGKQKENGM